MIGRCVLLLLLLLLAPASGSAVTLRYAIVVGNDTGTDATGKEPFPPLRHAEREARALRHQLQALSNFDADPERTVLLTGATREMLIDAAHNVARRKAADIEALGRGDSLFAFFFTGHGLEGQLLMEDGPLSGSDVGTVFSIVDADFNVAVFDACFSGSLDPDALTDKGIALSPGNIFRELPEEILTAEGSIWYVSSGPDEISYEDQNIGGVFTHFFTEALQSAQVDGPGITLEQIWHYTRNQTVRHTTKHGRRQVPQRYVTRLKSTGPLYFSFPVKRDATLVLTESVAGEFLVSYADGQLNERFRKHPGERKELAVYPGTARLMLLGKGGEVTVQDDLELGRGQTVTIVASEDPAHLPNLGGRAEVLWEKGLGEKSLRAEARVDDVTWSLGAGYHFDFVPAGFAAPQHNERVRLRVDFGPMVVGAHVGHGHRHESVGSWSYGLHALSYGASIGYGWNISRFRLSASLGVSVSNAQQQFDNGVDRDFTLIAPIAGLDAHVALGPRFGLALTLQAAVGQLPGAGRGSGKFWRFSPGGGASFFVRL